MTDSMDNVYAETDDEIDLEPDDEVYRLDELDEPEPDAEPVPDPDNPEGQGVSGPAAMGIPDHADDDSDTRAEREVDRESDGPAPAAMPADREDPTVGLGVSAQEQRRGETIEDRLDQEEPDVGEGR